MATYADLYALNYNLGRQDTRDIAKRVQVACWVEAEVIRNESAGTANHAERVVWAKKVFRGVPDAIWQADGGTRAWIYNSGFAMEPQAEVAQMVKMYLAKNKSSSVASLSNDTDANIQSDIAAAVDFFAV